MATIGDVINKANITANSPSGWVSDNYLSAFKDGGSNTPSSWRTYYVNSPYWYMTHYCRGSNGSSGAQIDVQIYSYTTDEGWVSHGTKTTSANNTSRSNNWKSTDFNPKASQWKLVIRTWGYYGWLGSYNCDFHLYIGGFNKFSDDEYNTHVKGEPIGYASLTWEQYSSDDAFLSARNPHVARGSKIMSGEYHFAIAN